MMNKKSEYKVTLVFESETAAQDFARRVMSREPPVGTETVCRVSEDYPRIIEAMDRAKQRTRR